MDPGGKTKHSLTFSNWQLWLQYVFPKDTTACVISILVQFYAVSESSTATFPINSTDKLVSFKYEHIAALTEQQIVEMKVDCLAQHVQFNGSHSQYCVAL